MHVILAFAAAAMFRTGTQPYRSERQLCELCNFIFAMISTEKIKYTPSLVLYFAAILVGRFTNLTLPFAGAVLTPKSKTRWRRKNHNRNGV